MKKQNTIIAASLVVLIGVFAVGAKLYKSAKSDEMSFLAQENASTFIRDYSPKKGAENPKVFLVEFLDPECESCRAFYPYVEKLLEEFPQQLQVVVRYVPFHKNSRKAIKALEASREQGKYWQALRTLFYYQPSWGDHHNPKPELIWTYLAEAGIDVEKAKKDAQNSKIEEIIKQDFADAKQLGVRATPTFFVNGRPLESFGYPQLRELVISELEK